MKKKINILIIFTVTLITFLIFVFIILHNNNTKNLSMENELKKVDFLNEWRKTKGAFNLHEDLLIIPDRFKMDLQKVDNNVYIENIKLEVYENKPDTNLLASALYIDVNKKEVSISDLKYTKGSIDNIIKVNDYMNLLNKIDFNEFFQLSNADNYSIEADYYSNGVSVNNKQYNRKIAIYRNGEKKYVEQEDYLLKNRVISFNIYEDTDNISAYQIYFELD